VDFIKSHFHGPSIMSETVL